MTAIPIGDAARLRPAAKRTAIVSAALAVAVGVSALAVNVAARRDEAPAPSLLPKGSSVVVVLDLSLSIPEVSYTRTRNAMRELAQSEARVGLVVFSDSAYELLPIGSPASELRPVHAYLTPIPGEINDRTGGPLYGPDPWSGGFRGGTRISVALERAREMIRREGGAGSILLISDLDTAEPDAIPLQQALARLRRDEIPMQIVPLYPLEENRTYFANQVGRDAFTDWNRFFTAGGVARRFEPREEGIPLGLAGAGAILLLALALNELRCRRLDLPGVREVA